MSGKGILEQIKDVEYTHRDMDTKDVLEILNDAYSNTTCSAPGITVGSGFILQLDDETFLKWYNGSLPSMQCICGSEGNKKIIERFNKLNTK